MKLNGEFRFSLRAASGNAYTRTIQPGAPAWQKDHLHEIVEWYAVDVGWVVFAQLNPADGVCTMTRYDAGQSFETTPNEPHNLFLSTAATLHTVKYGGGSHTWHGIDNKTPATGTDLAHLLKLKALTDATDSDALAKRKPGERWHP